MKRSRISTNELIRLGRCRSCGRLRGENGTARSCRRCANAENAASAAKYKPKRTKARKPTGKGVCQTCSDVRYLKSGVCATCTRLSAEAENENNLKLVDGEERPTYVQIEDIIKEWGKL